MKGLNPAFCPYCHDSIRGGVFTIDELQNIAQCSKCGRYVKDGKWGVLIFTAYKDQKIKFNPSRRYNNGRKNEDTS